MHGRVSPPGMQDWPVTADIALSAVSHAVVKQSKEIASRSAAQAEKPELYTGVIILSSVPAFIAEALEGLSRSLPRGCPQWLHLRSHFYLIPHFSVEVLQSLALRQGDWLEKTHWHLPS